MLPSLAGLTGGKAESLLRDFKRANQRRPAPRPAPRPQHRGRHRGRRRCRRRCRRDAGATADARAAPPPMPARVHEVNKNLRRIKPDETDEEFEQDMKSQKIPTTMFTSETNRSNGGSNGSAKFNSARRPKPSVRVARRRREIGWRPKTSRCATRHTSARRRRGQGSGRAGGAARA